MEKIKKFFVSESASKDIFFRPEEINDLTPVRLSEWIKKSSLNNYHPHLSVGIGEIKGIKFPINFIADKIGICHSGNYCSCGNVIVSYNLKS